MSKYINNVKEAAALMLDGLKAELTADKLFNPEPDRYK